MSRAVFTGGKFRPLHRDLSCPTQPFARPFRPTSRYASYPPRKPDQARRAGPMSTGTRNMWIGASLALVLGAGELVAYQGIAPHARKLRNPGRVVLRAGAVVARDLSALVAERAGQVASRVALGGVEQTTRLYRVAGRALGLELDAVPAGNTDPECGTVIASEPDPPCD